MTGREQGYTEKPLRLNIILNYWDKHNNVENAFSSSSNDLKPADASKKYSE